MSNGFTEHLTDQQKIDAVDNLFLWCGTGMPAQIKNFLFIAQNSFLAEDIPYSQKDAAENFYHLYDFFTKLEPKSKDDEK